MAEPVPYLDYTAGLQPFAPEPPPPPAPPPPRRSEPRPKQSLGDRLVAALIPPAFRPAPEPPPSAPVGSSGIVEPGLEDASFNPLHAGGNILAGIARKTFDATLGGGAQRAAGELSTLSPEELRNAPDSSIAPIFTAASLGLSPAAGKVLGNPMRERMAAWQRQQGAQKQYQRDFGPQTSSEPRMIPEGATAQQQQPRMNFDPNTVASGRPLSPDQRVVEVDPRAFDRAYAATDPDFRNGVIPGRSERLAEHVAQGNPVSMPEVGVYDGRVGVTNGRHRARMAADQGLERMPVAVDQGNEGAVTNMMRRHGQQFQQQEGTPGALGFWEDNPQVAPAAPPPAAPAVHGAPSYLTDEGLPIAGKDYTKASRAALDEIAAGPKGAGPLDLSTAGGIPNVEQRALERYTPPRGISPRMQDALANPDVSKGMLESIDKGIGLGADKWYHTEPIRQAFEKAYGPNGWQKPFADFMDTVAATSPRSDVPTNVRNASYYYAHMAQGKPLPAQNPYPYGHVAQNLHRQNYENILKAPSDLSAGTARSGTRWNVLQNPKPASFSQNLQGNLVPGTMDTHAFRNLAMRTGDPRFLETSFTQTYKPGVDRSTDSLVSRYGEITKPGIVTFRPQQLLEQGKLTMEEAKKLPSFWRSKPNDNEYAAIEELYRNLGAQRGLPTADAQAAAWSGAGELTGLGSPPSHTFPELLNERVLYTSKMRREPPEKTLQDFLMGRRPLLSVAGAAGGGAAAAGAMQQPEGEYTGPLRAFRQ